MNALLIYPEFPDTYWSFKHALKFLGKRAAQPPLGLMTAAALLPNPWKKRLIDTNVERLHDAIWKCALWSPSQHSNAARAKRHAGSATCMLKLVAHLPFFSPPALFASLQTSTFQARN